MAKSSREVTECTHTRHTPGYWDTQMGYVDDDNWGTIDVWIEGTDIGTYADTGTHTYKCTQCHKTFRY